MIERIVAWWRRPRCTWCWRKSWCTCLACGKPQCVKHLMNWNPKHPLECWRYE